MDDVEHLVIRLFRLHAEMMDSQADAHDADEAIVHLATWIDSVQHWLRMVCKTPVCRAHGSIQIDRSRCLRVSPREFSSARAR